MDDESRTAEMRSIAHELYKQFGSYKWFVTVCANVGPERLTNPHLTVYVARKLSNAERQGLEKAFRGLREKASSYTFSFNVSGPIRAA